MEAEPSLPAEAIVQPNEAREKDLKHLRWLAIAHYVLAGITLLSIIGVVRNYLLPGLALLEQREPVTELPPGFEVLRQPEFEHYLADPNLIGLLVLTVTVPILTLGIVHPIFLAYVGWLIARRRRRVSTIIFEIFDLTYCGLGTILSVATLIVLSRPSVVELYREEKARLKAAKK